MPDHDDIDHVTFAHHHLEMAAQDVSLSYEALTGERKSDVIAVAQTYALLALEKQVRIRNIIEYSKARTSQLPDRAQIEMALGL